MLTVCGRKPSKKYTQNVIEQCQWRLKCARVSTSNSGLFFFFITKSRRFFLSRSWKSFYIFFDSFISSCIRLANRVRREWCEKSYNLRRFRLLISSIIWRELFPACRGANHRNVWRMITEKLSDLSAPRMKVRGEHIIQQLSLNWQHIERKL